MKHFVLNLRTFKTVVASSEQEAKNLGNGSIIFRSAEQLAKNPNTTGQILVRAFNELSPVETKKFADKISGSKRLFKLAESSAPKNDFYGQFKFLDQVVDMNEYKEKAAASDEKRIDLYRHKVLSDKSEPTKGGGKFAGKIITCLVSENPRREGTRGWKNYNIFIENDGISYEDFVDIAANHGSTRAGCREDLAHDIKKGRVVLSLSPLS